MAQPGQGVGTFYPKGFSNGVSVLGQPVLNVQTGTVWWVSSLLGADGNPGTFRAPFATWARAWQFVQRGDTIMLMAGHAENISSATALTFSVQGVQTIGLGIPGNRPTITLDTATTSTINVSAAGCSVSNVGFRANFAAVASAFTLTTGKGFALDNCKFIAAVATTTYFVSIITTDTVTNDNDNISVTNSEWTDTNTANNYFVSMLGTNDKMLFANNYVNIGIQNNTPVVLNLASGKSLTNVNIQGNRLIRLNTSVTGGFLAAVATSTNSGMIADNYMYAGSGGTDLVATASSGFSYFNNYYSAAADDSGYLLPAADV